MVNGPDLGFLPLYARVYARVYMWISGELGVSHKTGPLEWHADSLLPLLVFSDWLSGYIGATPQSNTLCIA